MASPTQSQRAYRSLLYDQTLASPSGTNTEGDIGNETDGDLVLNSGEWGEITHYEIFPFLKTTGGADFFEHIIPKIDNTIYRGGTTLRIRADLDSLFAVPFDLVTDELSVGIRDTRKMWRIGWSLPELLDMGIDRNPNLILNNSTIKVKEKGTINTHYLTGSTAVGASETMRVRAWGVRYTDMGMADFYAKSVYHPERGVGLPIVLQDKKTGRQFSSSVGVDYVDARKSWSKMVGGNDIHLKDGVVVDYINYWARNDGAATTASKDFDMSFTQNNVLLQANDMFPQVDDRTLYYITNLGVIDYSGNLRYIWMKGNRNILFQERLDTGDPNAGTQTVNNAVNSRRFGRVTNTGANVFITDHRFRPLPLIDPLFGHNESFGVSIRDNGTSISKASSSSISTTFSGPLIVWAGYVIQDKNLVVEVPNKITGFIGGGRSING